jgi:hypothetical protein
MIFYCNELSFVLTYLNVEKLSHDVTTQAIERVFDMLGQDIKQVMIYHLEVFHGFVLGEHYSLVHLGKALSRIIGSPAAEMLLERVYVEIDKIIEANSRGN